MEFLLGFAALIFIIVHFEIAFAILVIGLALGIILCLAFLLIGLVIAFI